MWGSHLKYRSPFYMRAPSLSLGQHLAQTLVPAGTGLLGGRATFTHIGGEGKDSGHHGPEDKPYRPLPSPKLWTLPAWETGGPLTLQESVPPLSVPLAAGHARQPLY